MVLDVLTWAPQPSSADSCAFKSGRGEAKAGVNSTSRSMQQARCHKEPRGHGAQDMSTHRHGSIGLRGGCVGWRNGCCLPDLSSASTRGLRFSKRPHF
eukprot:scaffold43882_cov30-Tisochrysis_lutea.AAC.2